MTIPGDELLLLRWCYFINQPSKLTTTIPQDEDPVTLVNFGDWAAQWDELEAAW